MALKETTEEVRALLGLPDRRGAIIDPSEQYRYVLTRCGLKGVLSEPGNRNSVVTFVMLNPSTADGMRDDPTIRRCMGYARLWGFSAMIVVNLFAYRTTHPVVLRQAKCDVVGPRNDEFIEAAAAMSRLTVAAWGVHGAYMNRGAQVASRLNRPHVLRLTKDGHPAHPLMLPRNLKPWEWR